MPWSRKAPIASRIWSRSKGASAEQPVVPAAVGDRRQPEHRKLGRKIAGGHRGPIVLPGQQTQDHVLADRSGGDPGGAGVGNIVEPVGENSAENAHELPVSVRVAGHGHPHRLERLRKLPLLEGSAVPERARLVLKGLDVMPGVVGRLVPTEQARMAADHLVVRHEDQPVGRSASVGMLSTAT